MRALQKIIRHGNAAGVSLPRAMLFHLGWLPGQSVILELLEDKSVRIRLPREADFAPLRAPHLIDRAVPSESR